MAWATTSATSVYVFGVVCPAACPSILTHFCLWESICLMSGWISVKLDTNTHRMHGRSFRGERPKLRGLHLWEFCGGDVSTFIESWSKLASVYRACGENCLQFSRSQVRVQGRPTLFVECLWWMQFVGGRITVKLTCLKYSLCQWRRTQMTVKSRVKGEDRVKWIQCFS